MGIPSYFSYIIKNYSNIISNLSKLHKNNVVVDNLFMDCNSIIYDVFNSLPEHEKCMFNDNIENIIIERVIAKIEYYITLLNPSNNVFIAFDGVAPFAKMEQQRTRRYKSTYMCQHIDPILRNRQKNEDASLWSTCSITPGTQFMNRLSHSVREHFIQPSKLLLRHIIVSASDIPGEGEHKMFEYLRNSMNAKSVLENLFVYGLDSDLIMLSIFHKELTKNIYVCREAPEFSKSQLDINSLLKKTPHSGVSNKVGTFSQDMALQHMNASSIPPEMLFMDIGMLSNAILLEMDCIVSDKHRIYDYIILCFFLGNDFLPHFPSLNIRKSGIQILIETYRAKIGSSNDLFFVSKENGNIQWRTLQIFIRELVKHEHSHILQEYFIRDKMSKYKYAQNTYEEREKMLSNTPIIYRADELYICPNEKMWEHRYYRVLFSKERTNTNVKQICLNYMQGLEWVYKYYTKGCPDWKWKYHYNYPPLLCDLIKYIPNLDTHFIDSNNVNNKPFHPQVQLTYVLPPNHYNLIGTQTRTFIETHLSYLSLANLKFQWAFCRYFWESHVILQDISMDTLEELNSIVSDDPVHTKFIL
jgi:5'-3' exonuclease